MAINPLSSAGPATIAGAGTTPKISEGFGQVFKSQGAQPPRTETPNPSVQEAKTQSQAISGQKRVEANSGPLRTEATNSATHGSAKMIDELSAAQGRMEQILKLAESGKSFSPAELLSLQAHVYRASQELDLAGKVVEKATGGVKQVLQTQV